MKFKDTIKGIRDIPLKNGGSRLVPRKNGKFSVANAGCKICNSCGQIICKDTKNVGSEQFPFLKETWPDKCPSCGNKEFK